MKIQKNVFLFRNTGYVSWFAEYPIYLESEKHVAKYFEPSEFKVCILFWGFSKPIFAALREKWHNYM